MRNVWTIAKREFAHYFVSPIAYAVATLFLSILGLLFVVNVNGLAAQGGEPSMGFVFGPLTSLILFFAPVLTMRLMAEEQSKGTMELLLTAPIKEWELVIGKWLGAWFFGLALVATTVVFPLVLLAYGNPDMGPVYSGYLGMALLVGAILAVGLLASALTGNLIVSVAIGYTFVLTIWIIGIAGDLLTAFTGQATGILSSLVNYLDFSNHFSATFGRGVIDTVDIVYYLSVIAIALFLATRVVEARRWR
ncbi:MAG: ABC transporter permease subunit [Chloroflexi bacterium]|nr:ABC transporter permease subunit [Chloroflexota bacterium]MBI4315336.1 ABC transporter permease subunit [Chloroflexota bacterium]